MKVAVFSSKKFEIEMMRSQFESQKLVPVFFEAHLTESTAPLAAGCESVCAFVSDTLNAGALTQLKECGVKLIALRSAGFNNVDLVKAKELGLPVVRVPAYSPHAIAEHTLALILSLNRKTHKAYQRVREGNFSLDGLMGFDLAGKTAGIIGTGKIGSLVAKILLGFEVNVIAYDLFPNPELQKLGIKYVSLSELMSESQIISLHCPLTPETKYLINKETLSQTQKNVMIINTGRGGLVNTADVIKGLKSGKVGYLCLDVYEEEADLFFEDHSDSVIKDDVFSRLLTFPNVLITGHQGFFTHEAVDNIIQTTVNNIVTFRDGKILVNEVR